MTTPEAMKYLRALKKPSKPIRWRNLKPFGIRSKQDWEAQSKQAIQWKRIK